MNQFNINQNAYYVMTLKGQLIIECMRIDEIKQDKHGVYYSGYVYVEDKDGQRVICSEISHRETWREEGLFPSQVKAIESIETQLKAFKGE